MNLVPGVVRIEPLTAGSIRSLLALLPVVPTDDQVSQLLEAVGPVDRALGALNRASDLVVGDMLDRQGTLADGEVDCGEQVLGKLIDATDSLLLVRASMLTKRIPIDDPCISNLIALADAYASSVHNAVAV